MIQPMYEEIGRKVKALIAIKKSINQDEIHANHSFSDLNMDSLEAINLLRELEDYYNVVLPNECLLQIKTIQEIVNSFEKLLEE